MTKGQITFIGLRTNYSTIPLLNKNDKKSINLTTLCSRSVYETYHRMARIHTNGHAKASASLTREKCATFVSCMSAHVYDMYEYRYFFREKPSAHFRWLAAMVTGPMVFLGRSVSRIGRLVWAISVTMERGGGGGGGWCRGEGFSWLACVRSLGRLVSASMHVSNANS